MKTDRVVFLKSARPYTTCPFYEGHGAGKGVFEKYQKYCTCQIVIEKYNDLPPESMLQRCCNVFVVPKTIKDDAAVNEKIESALKADKNLRKKVSGSKK